MEISPSWEANRFVTSKGIPRILWKQKVHYRIHKRAPTLPILSQLDQVHTTISHFLKINFNIILPSTLGFPKWSLSPMFPNQILAYASPLSTRATTPVHLILLYFITRTILGEKNRLFSSSLCSFLPGNISSRLPKPPVLCESSTR